MNKETGGAAFPNYRSDEFANWGMTLRDYFAAKAMQAIAPQVKSKSEADELCKSAYEISDAMIEARK